jgi:hypothetical protein
MININFAVFNHQLFTSFKGAIGNLDSEHRKKSMAELP